MQKDEFYELVKKYACYQHVIACLRGSSLTPSLTPQYEIWGEDEDVRNRVKQELKIVRKRIKEFRARGEVEETNN